jgi:hypothetical protein
MMILNSTQPGNLQPDLYRPHMNRVGGRDGATWTCDPHRLLEKEDCVVHSIFRMGHTNGGRLIDLLVNTVRFMLSIL